MESHIPGGTIGMETRNTFGPEVTPASTAASADWKETVLNHLLCRVTAIPVYPHYYLIAVSVNSFQLLLYLKTYYVAGVITVKNLLPIARLNFGRTILDVSSGQYTLGRLECSGLVAVTGMPKSCEDLWRIGHTLSGLYSVMGTAMVENIYCDFTKLPSDAGTYN
jgi:hypothetical protein